MSRERRDSDEWDLLCRWYIIRTTINTAELQGEAKKMSQHKHRYISEMREYC